MAKKLDFKKIVDQVINKAPGLVVGSLASGWVEKGVASMLKDKATPKITAGIVLLAGAVLPSFIGGSSKKDQFMQSVCDGMMAQGAFKLAQEFKIAGMDDNISGTEEDAMSGTDTSNSVSGAD